MSREHWVTPPWLFEALDTEFNFTVDVCALESNRKCATYFSPEVDGLAQNWGTGRCWMNPPYGLEIGMWMQKAYESAQNGATVVALIPSRTNPPWWHKYVMKASEVRFIVSKVQFIGRKHGVPFWGNTIAIFRPNHIGDPKFVSWQRPKPNAEEPNA